MRTELDLDDTDNRREWTVVHTVTQTVKADSADEAERTARKALEDSADLWWVNVLEGAEVEHFG